jgi:hypothetical protein
MSTLSAEKSHSPKRAASRKGSAKSNTTVRPAVGSTAADAEKFSNPNKTTTKKASGKSNPAPGRKPAAPTALIVKTPTLAVETSPMGREAHEPKVESATKQNRMLTLLSRPEGATIEEMMQATDWQQHSVRGFLAGTVKKKLGFSLTSSKPDDEARRYRIQTRRGR